MKHKLILFLSLLLGISLLLCIEPTGPTKNPKVFASPNQSQTVKLTLTDKQSNPKDLEEISSEKTVFSEENKMENNQSGPTVEIIDTTVLSSDSKIVSTKENKEEPEIEQETGEQNQVTEDEPPTRKKVYLTFDDGPSPTTEILLNILRDYQVPATFFLLESQMHLFPSSITRIASEGHGLGLHGVTHDLHLFYQSAETALAEMNQAQVTLAKLTGITSFLVRTPFGSKPHMTETHKEVMTKAGFIIWDWNVDSKDWYFKDARLVDYTIKQLQVLEEKGIDPVILLHDNKYTINYLPQLLDYLIENYYEFEILDPSMEPITF